MTRVGLAHSGCCYHLPPPGGLFSSSHLANMLRVGIFASVSPLSRQSLNAIRCNSSVVSFRSFGRTIHSRPNILETLRTRPNAFSSSYFYNSFRSSRGITNSAIITRPTQQEAWKRYAVTAVRGIFTMSATQSHYVVTGYRSRYSRGH